MMNKRFVSLWFRHLLTDWLTLKRPELAGVPFVFAAPVHNRIIVTATNPLGRKAWRYTGVQLLRMLKP